MEEKNPLKQFEKSDKELIYDIIDMELLDASEPIYTKEGVNNNEKFDVIQGKGSEA